MLIAPSSAKWYTIATIAILGFACTTSSHELPKSFGDGAVKIAGQVNRGSVAIAAFRLDDFMYHHAKALLLANGFAVGSDTGLLGISLAVPESQATSAASLLRRDARLRNYSLRLHTEKGSRDKTPFGWEQHIFLLPYRRVVQLSDLVDPPGLNEILAMPETAAAAQKYPYVIRVDSLCRDYLSVKTTSELGELRVGFVFKKGYEVNVVMGTSADEKAIETTVGFQVTGEGTVTHASWRDRPGAMQLQGSGTARSHFQDGR